ncbi:MAG: ABC transporter substrate-binding protein [Limnohabitans sp.]|nr:ABC transporter substrate-binding protein [Limnohabitans sp.]
MPKLMLILLLLWQSAAALTVIDDRQQQVTLNASPQRIITLLPSLAETVCELGACERLVATDNYADWPASVKALPKLGGLYDASVEAIVRLQPDFVLVGKSTRIIGRLESLGIKVVVLETQSLADVQRSMHTIAQVLQLPQPQAAADRLWQQAVLAIDQAAKKIPAAAQGASFYFEASTGGYAAGEASFIGGVMQRLGLRNTVTAAMGAFPQVNPEFVVRASPQWVFLAEPSAVALHKRPGWSAMAAVKAGRVCAFNAAQGHVLVRPGPRIGEAANILVKCLQKVATP